MSRSMQYRVWSLAVRLRFGRPLLWEIHPRHPPRAVSARATNSLFLSAALSSHSLPAGRELGAALVWGEEGILSPARAPPRSFGVRPSHNPSPRFHSCVCLVAFASHPPDFDEGRRSSFAIGRQAETAPRQMQMLAPSPLEDERTSPTRARRRGLPYGVLIYKMPLPCLPT